MADGEITGKKAGNIAVKQEKLFENGGSQLQNARKFSDLECVPSAHGSLKFLRRHI
jgi:hypothetical protein